MMINLKIYCTTLEQKCHLVHADNFNISTDCLLIISLSQHKDIISLSLRDVRMSKNDIIRDKAANEKKFSPKLKLIALPPHQP
jgi:hypothetical protein